MILLSKSIRKRMLKDNRIRKYLLYASGEIVLVVLGILIALQINNWNDQRQERKEEKRAYDNVKQQILGDLKELQVARDINNYFFAQYAYGNKIIQSNDRSQIDTLAYITLMLSQYSDFHREGNIHSNLASGGDLKLMKNYQITNGLQKLDNTYNHVNKLEDIHWEIIMNQLTPTIKGVINYATLQIMEPDKLFDVETQNIFIESIYLTRGKDSIYSQASREIQGVLDLIDKELN